MSTERLPNLAFKFVRDQGKCVAGCREEYDDACIDFAGDFQFEYAGAGARLAYFDNLNHPTWRYHAAVEIGGVIHDLWQEQAYPIEEYMLLIGASSVEYPAEEPEAA